MVVQRTKRSLNRIATYKSAGDVTNLKIMFDAFVYETARDLSQKLFQITRLSNISCLRFQSMKND